MSRAPYRRGDLIAVLHYDPVHGTASAITSVTTCRPDETNGFWRITYPLNGLSHEVTVNAAGTDKHTYVTPIR